ncbi:uncharacterized protein [Pleurodeles waltl]
MSVAASDHQNMADTSLRLHTEKLILPHIGENVLVQCQFQYKHNFTLDKVHILWGKEIAQDEYSVLVIFDGKKVQRFNENASFHMNSLLQGKASLLLENVTTTDSGTYLCDVTVNASNSKGRTQVYVIRTGHLCKEDLPFQNVYKAPVSDTTHSFPNRSIGAIVAIAVLLVIVLSMVVYVRCKKRSPAVEVTP